MAMSRIGEYFDINIKSQNDAAARLEALRTEASETILYVIDATYLPRVYQQSGILRFEPYRGAKQAAQLGARFRDRHQNGCKPVLLEGLVYFVSRDGGRLYATNYDAVSEAFKPDPVNDLCDDLVSNIKRMLVQRKSGTMTKRSSVVAARGWPPRGLRRQRQSGDPAVCVRMADRRKWFRSRHVG